MNSVTMNLLGASVGGHIFCISLGDIPQREIGYSCMFQWKLPNCFPKDLGCGTVTSSVSIPVFYIFANTWYCHLFLAILVSVRWCNDLFCGCRTNDDSLHPRGRLPARLQPFPVRGQCREDCADLVYSSGGRPQGWPNAQHPGYSSMMTLDS